jgi:tetratricopeptide (TPR) repeat protein
MTIRFSSTCAVTAILMGLALGVAPAARAADTISPAALTKADLKPARDKIAAGDFAGAIPILTTVLKDSPKDPDALNLMGFSLRKTGKWQDALSYYNQALAIEPKHLGANEYLGELHAERGEMDKAKERLAILEAACGKDCQQTKDLAQAIQKGPTKK